MSPRITVGENIIATTKIRNNYVTIQSFIFPIYGKQYRKEAMNPSTKLLKNEAKRLRVTQIISHFDGSNNKWLNYLEFAEIRKVKITRSKTNIICFYSKEFNVYLYIRNLKYCTFNTI